MTPEILTLSRTICGMEGAPKPDRDGVRVWPLFTGRRSKSGALWFRTEAQRYVLDLTDAATGGALLPYIGTGWVIYQRDYDRALEISRLNGVDFHEGETLGIAIAKVIAARGWGHV